MKKLLLTAAAVVLLAAQLHAGSVDSVKVVAKIDSLKAVRAELGKEIGRVTAEIYTLKMLCGDTLNIITGKRGGRYYIDDKGRKVYIKKQK